MSTASVVHLQPIETVLLEAAKEVAEFASSLAARRDEEYSFPDAEVSALHRVGLLLAPFPRRLGGENLARGDRAAQVLPAILRQLGGGSLSLGRLYEGHINAAALVMRYGSADQMGEASKEAARGALLGVWNTDDAEGLRLAPEDAGWRLKGKKALCSGAGFINRPLVTARDERERIFMVMPRLAGRDRADLALWKPQGMRASATGTVDFSEIQVSADDIIGKEGDYHRQPAFSGGAWRFAAVQLGAMEKLFDLLRQHLVRTKRGSDPHQSARVGEAAIAVETARLWVERAAHKAEIHAADADATVAYVNLARLVVERAGLDLLELAHRSIGLASFMQANPIERISRDLATYFRQPAPDRALTNAAMWALNQEGSPSGDLWR